MYTCLRLSAAGRKKPAIRGMPRGILFFCAVFGLTALVGFAGVAMRTAAATSAVARNAFAPDLFYYKISYYAYNGEPDDNYRRNFKRTNTMPQSISFLVR